MKERVTTCREGLMIPRKGHHMEGRVTTWREGSPHGGKGVNDSKEGSPHGGKGHHMEGRV